MRVFIFCMLIVFAGNLLNAQKKPLNNEAIRHWPYISNPQISNDGKYLLFEYSEGKGVILTIQPTDLLWKKEFHGARSEQFSADSKRVSFLNDGDSLVICELENNTCTFIDSVSGFAMPEKGDGRYLVYKKKESGETILVDFKDGQKKSFGNLSSFDWKSGSKDIMVYEKKISDVGERRALYWFNLSSGKCIKMCESKFFSNRQFDRTGERFLFTTMDTAGGFPNRSIFVFREGMDSAKKIVDENSIDMKGYRMADGPTSFSNFSNNIFFPVIPRTVEKKISDEKTPIVWSCLDDETDDSGDLRAIAVADENEPGKITMLGCHQGDTLTNTGAWKQSDSDLLLCECRTSLTLATDKREHLGHDLYLINVSNRSKKLLQQNLVSNQINISPAKKYVTWFDKRANVWFAYNILTGKTKNISQGIHTQLCVEKYHPDLPEGVGLAAWLEHDEGTLIYDRFDIWRVDPEAKLAPVNLTNGYGYSHKTQLRILDFNSGSYAYYDGASQPVSKSDTLIVTAFDVVNKDNGFFTLEVGIRKFTRQAMYSKSFWLAAPYPIGCTLVGETDPMYPLKAKEANIWLLAPADTKSYPNLVLTRDFKTFTPVTSFAPQKNFMWYSNQLIKWKLPDGQIGEGILYKPENFNPQKKYPVIFTFYERNSFALHYFINPVFTGSSINVPWFTSRGYLVFTPDIYFKTGYPGQSALDAVVSAAKWLSKQEWVDSRKMGIEGHSFGGFETNYIITRSKMFAAASTASGMSNLVSAYGADDGDNHIYYEQGQGRIGASLWDMPDRYIMNSPIFYAEKVTTPLLIMHNRQDSRVPFSQALEWFDALSSLHKKVWLLSYTGEGHTLDNDKNQEDYSKKLGEFFDHFLKGAPVPEWMKEQTD